MANSICDAFETTLSSTPFIDLPIVCTLSADKEIKYRSRWMLPVCVVCLQQTRPLTMSLPLVQIKECSCILHVGCLSHRTSMKLDCPACYKSFAPSNIQFVRTSGEYPKSVSRPIEEIFVEMERKREKDVAHPEFKERLRESCCRAVSQNDSQIKFIPNPPTPTLPKIHTDIIKQQKFQRRRR